MADHQNRYRNGKATIALINEGGGPDGVLVISTEGRTPEGIDAQQIERLAQELANDSA